MSVATSWVMAMQIPEPRRCAWCNSTLPLDTEAGDAVCDDCMIAAYEQCGAAWDKPALEDS